MIIWSERDWHKLLLALSHLHLKIQKQNSKHFLTWILREFFFFKLWFEFVLTALVPAFFCQEGLSFFSCGSERTQTVRDLTRLQTKVKMLGWVFSQTWSFWSLSQTIYFIVSHKREKNDTDGMSTKTPWFDDIWFDFMVVYAGTRKVFVE